MRRSRTSPAPSASTARSSTGTSPARRSSSRSPWSATSTSCATPCAAAGARPPLPAERLRAIVGAFVDYGVAHPAFVDCAQALMRRRGDDLLDEISESALFRLGRAISSCLAILIAALEDGVASGRLHRRRRPRPAGQHALRQRPRRACSWPASASSSTETAPGVPTVGAISPDQVREHLVASALALASHAAPSLTWRRSVRRVDACSRPATPVEGECGRRTDRRRRQARSRIATTPWPPAAQIEITPRPVPPSDCASSLASTVMIRPPVAANGWPAASEEPLTLSLAAVDRAQRRVEAEALLAEHRVLPRLERREHLRGERLVDLVEVEVLQRQALAGQHPRHRRTPGPSAGPRRRGRSRPPRSRSR